MTKQEFRDIFRHALEKAVQNAESKLGHAIPHDLRIELHGQAAHPRQMSVDEALDALYLGPDKFFRVIDVAVRNVSNTTTTVFMGISGHAPCRLEETWNDPPGAGPFKQIMAERIASS